MRFDAKRVSKEDLDLLSQYFSVSGFRSDEHMRCQHSSHRHPCLLFMFSRTVQTTGMCRRRHKMHYTATICAPVVYSKVIEHATNDGALLRASARMLLYGQAFGFCGVAESAKKRVASRLQ